MLADAWPPAVFQLAEEFFPAPTVELTVHFRAALPLAGATAEDFHLVRFQTMLVRDGFFEEDGAIWSRDGQLLAQSRQLALALPRPAPADTHGSARIGLARWPASELAAVRERPLTVGGVHSRAARDRPRGRRRGGRVRARQPQLRRRVARADAADRRLRALDRARHARASAAPTARGRSSSSRSRVRPASSAARSTSSASARAPRAARLRRPVGPRVGGRPPGRVRAASC